MRRLLLSTVFRNVADAAGGGAPAPKPEDAPAAVVADAGAGDAAAAVADSAAAAPAGDAPAGDAAAPAPTEGDKPAEGAASEPARDFAAETLLTGEQPKPEDKPAAPDAAPTDAKPAEGDKAAAADAGVGKPEDKPAEGAAKAGDAPPAPKEAPVYTYEFPEGLSLDAESLKPVNETFAKHGISPEVAKELMGLHTGALKAFAEQAVNQGQEDQRRIWAETRGNWRNEIRADEQIGGAGYETNLRRAAEVRDRLVPKDQMAAFNRMLLVTGVGDHPEFIRFCVNAHRYVGEGSVPAQQGNPTAHNGQPGGRRRIRDTYKSA